MVITHEMNSAFHIGDELAVLSEGKIVEVGTPEEIRASSNPYVQQFVRGRPQMRGKNWHDGP